MTITRTDSSGWGNALLSESFNSGVIRITFFIENDGDSSYLYIGVVATAEEYPMDSAIGSDCSHKLWSWKRSGEFHTNGEQSSRSEGNFGTGDTVILEINLDAKIMTCIKNDAPVYTFNNIEGDVRPVVSIGGENQLIVIKSVERLIGGSNS